MSEPILIKGGRIIDPAAGRDEIGDLFVEHGLIAPKPSSLPEDVEIIDASGFIVAPGLIDLHVHFREPGGEEKETIESGSRAAAHGGFTTVVTMPNTSPPIDSAERVAWLVARGEEVGLVRILPAACITRERAGEKLADLDDLAAAGAAAFTDDGSTVPSDVVMREAMVNATRLRKTILDHAQDRAMELKGGVMHEGEYSRRWNLPGIPAEAEVSVIERDIALAEETGCRLHIQHVSTAAGVERIREARSRGVAVSGEATPHHLALSDADVRPEDANFKMNPPLRSRADQEAICRGVIDGTLEALATDHAPHTTGAKAKGFMEAPFGIIGLETAIGVTYTALVNSGRMDAMTWLARWTTGPARILGLEEPSLREGARADVVILNLGEEWSVNTNDFQTLSRNTPFKGWTLTGRACHTICNGRMTWPLPRG